MEIDIAAVMDALRTMAIDRVSIHWEAAFAKSYRLEISEDARQWKTVHVKK